MGFAKTLKIPTDGIKSVPTAILNTLRRASKASLSDYRAIFVKVADKALWTNPLREKTTLARALSFSYLALVFFITLQFQLAFITPLLTAFCAFKILDTACILLYKVTPGIYDTIEKKYNLKRETQPNLYAAQILWKLLREGISIPNAGASAQRKEPTKPNGDSSIHGTASQVKNANSVPSDSLRPEEKTAESGDEGTPEHEKVQQAARTGAGVLAARQLDLDRNAVTDPVSSPEPTSSLNTSELATRQGENGSAEEESDQESDQDRECKSTIASSVDGSDLDSLVSGVSGPGSL